MIRKLGNIAYLMFIIILVSCSDKKENRDSVINYYLKKNLLIKEEYSGGHIKTKSTMTKDSFLINDRMEYYSNGKIKKWFWYNKPNDYPLFIVYYDSLGKYMKYKGTPFIRSGTNSESYVVIEMVNPPNLNIYLTYKDFHNNDLKRQIIYEPLKTDSTLWITLDEHKFNINHSYYIIYQMFEILLSHHVFYLR